MKVLREGLRIINGNVYGSCYGLKFLFKNISAYLGLHA